ncbi:MULTISPECIES: cytochrome P450 [unclassified Rhodococcus (in: high G+C Gram-positive bacteria)]|uniref:cytochrome P450 n=1 Tax=unclassified Rhodococcus (in: high G+C Gram-positive bacteria) TaxID=192944 RepID=UPI00163A2360|nr:MULTISPECIES: cytochrome P450 [unclassified Rhodococcus (in: high G+C Gram-positive bacteria)]MBC2640074.1 cytochrome P450 [Rhodococcus sp. 3A]MBC2895180.1 cytochrome P450 [Rhodococcus sp. 4CII]
MSRAQLFQRITDQASRPNPYPLYEELRETRVAPQDDGSYLVGRYYDVMALLHDPRISSDLHNRGAGLPGADRASNAPDSFLKLDPPEHDRLRRLTTRQFGPPHSPHRIDSMRGELATLVTELVDGLDGKERIDVVDDFAYPFPVSVICRLLGVPHEEEPRFHAWADELVASIDPRHNAGGNPRAEAAQKAQMEMAMFMAGLIEERRRNPGDDMLSGLANDSSPDGQLDTVELVTNSILLFIAGHETTVNLITNGMLTLLRNPEALERLRAEPELMPHAVEELLRFEPPVHLLGQRTPIVDIDIDGVTVPKGSPLVLALASANRDPERFDDADRFVPDRKDNQHVGLGSGIHSCFGAPLARLEGQMALTELIRRLPNPRLVEDPPPYRPNPVLRGPRHLLVDCG